MKNYSYNSVLKNEIADFLALRKSQGIKDHNDFIFQKLDKHLIANNICDKQLTPVIIDGWLSESLEGLSKTSANSYITHYNALAKYLETLGITAFKPETRGKEHSYVPYVFDETEILRLIDVSDNISTVNTRTTSKIQFPVLIRLLYSCGLRLGEALYLRKGDVDVENGILTIRSAKGNKDRFVPMHNSMTDILLQYCNHFLKNKPNDFPLFSSIYVDSKRDCINHPLNSSWAQNRFQQALKDANISLLPKVAHRRNICLHCLRHTFAVHSFRIQENKGEKKSDIFPYISIYLGHTELEETQKYIHMTAENSEDILDLFENYSRGMFPEVPNEK